MGASRNALVVAGGRVVLPDRIIDADLLVQDGKIAGIREHAARGTTEPALPATPNSQTVDAHGLMVMAGMIDTHVHLRDPGHPHRETFGTGTSAAAVGGITTVLEMPSGIPAVADAKSWHYKNDVVGPKAYVDFGLYGGAGHTNTAQIAEQAAAGAIAFKSFMNAPGPGADPGFDTRALPDDTSFLAAMKAIAATGRVAVVHAESDSICGCLAALMKTRGRNDLRAHAESRPPVAEEEAVARAIRLAGAAGSRLSIAHISTGAAVEQVRRAKARGQDVTAEACPHHLFHTLSNSEHLGPYAKVNPPLRDHDDVTALWAGLADGTIDYIGTDHAPYTIEDKDKGWSDIWSAPSGVHGLESVLPALLTAVNDGQLSLPQLTRVISQRASQVFGLHSKGHLREGSDADFILVDMDRLGVIDPSGQHSVSRSAAKLWAGRATRGSVVATYVRGTLVAEDGELRGQPGHGQLVRPEGRP
ncbi:allantoinase AllB [Paenarthrobacter sp. NPDC056912]|uniref:allantoinase AllB n=1 Tax=Paenarthrobacter sp. NPDC056912 TaxID=3345965 RepID=UPI00366BFEB9